MKKPVICPECGLPLTNVKPIEWHVDTFGHGKPGQRPITPSSGKDYVGMCAHCAKRFILLSEPERYATID